MVYEHERERVHACNNKMRYDALLASASGSYEACELNEAKFFVIFVRIEPPTFLS